MADDNNTRSTLILVLVVVGVILSAVILVVLMKNSEADTSTPVPAASEDLSVEPSEAAAAAKKFAAGNSWPSHGGNIENTRFSKSENKIGPENVSQLALKWSKQLGGNIQATPVVHRGVVYITDRSGNVYAFDEDTGDEIWHVTLLVEVRNAPAIYKDTLIMGDQAGYLLALSMVDGHEVWKVKHSNYSTPGGIYDRITQAPTVFQDRVYVGFASNEEGLATQSWFTCCEFVGSFWALDAATGAEIWHTDMVDASLPRGVIDANADPIELGYSGTAIWGSAPAIDLKRKQIYIATGNNYDVPNLVGDCIRDLDTIHTVEDELECMDDGNYVDAIMALDMDTGAINWVNRVEGFDAWTVACIPGVGTWCPSPEGPDFDFAQAPMLMKFKAANGSMKELVGAGQKSGVFWAVDPDTGITVWATNVGPGGTTGGIQWGSAFDGERIYVAVANTPHTLWPLKNPAPGSARSTTGGIWSALDPETGDILWQSADPAPLSGNGFLDLSRMAYSPLTVANGVVYAASMSRMPDDSNHLALDAATGEVLWDVPAAGSVAAGPAVVNGQVYWGSGYQLGGAYGSFGNTFYVYSIGGV